MCKGPVKLRASMSWRQRSTKFERIARVLWRGLLFDVTDGYGEGKHKVVVQEEDDRLNTLCLFRTCTDPPDR